MNLFVCNGRTRYVRSDKYDVRDRFVLSYKQNGLCCVENLLFVLQINTAFNTFRGLTLDKILYIQKDKVALKLYT